jgi:hypothetical protein
MYSIFKPFMIKIIKNAWSLGLRGRLELFALVPLIIGTIFLIMSFIYFGKFCGGLLGIFSAMFSTFSICTFLIADKLKYKQ